MSSAAATLKQRLAKPALLPVPGAGTPLDVRLAEQAGFEACYLSGYALACLRHGLPDIGLIGFAELIDHVRACRAISDLPLIVDADTGYGDVANIRRTVVELERLGVAAIQIEDQLWPKRCGHMDGKRVEPRATALRKIEAALAARTNPDTLIIARTDARGPVGLDEAMDRCRDFAAAGADMLFVDGPTGMEELQRICAEAPAPMMANMSETGLTPILSAAELEAIGFRLAIWPSTTARITVRQHSAFLRELRATGDSRPWLDRMASLAETNSLLGADAYREFDARFTPDQEMES